MTKQVKYTLCTMENNAHAIFVQILNISYCNMNAQIGQEQFSNISDILLPHL